MHIELVETLRCPQPHEDTWLVASVSRFDGREIVEGTLGCPSCRRQYPVLAGLVDFTDGVRGLDAGPGAAADALPAPDDDALLRARALLALDDGGGVVLLGGTLARCGPPLEDQVQVATLLLNPAPPPPAGRRHRSSLRTADLVPIAAASLRAAWLDAATATPALLAGVARALRPGGRLVAPAGCDVPAGLRELARDGREWVAESLAAASIPVTLRRRDPGPHDLGGRHPGARDPRAPGV